MSDMRDLSELPRDEAYWRDLEARVRDGMASRPHRSDEASWMQPLASRAAGLGWLAAAGLAALLMASGRPDRQPASLPFLDWPDEPLAGAFLAPSPPSLALLLISATVEKK